MPIWACINTTCTEMFFSAEGNFSHLIFGYPEKKPPLLCTFVLPHHLLPCCLPNPISLPLQFLQREKY